MHWINQELRRDPANECLPRYPIETQREATYETLFEEVSHCASAEGGSDLWLAEALRGLATAPEVLGCSFQCGEQQLCLVGLEYCRLTEAGAGCVPESMPSCDEASSSCPCTTTEEGGIVVDCR